MPGGQSVVHFLHESVQSFPHAEAIVDGDRRTTYRDLWNGVSSLATLLLSEGLAKGERVGILSDNCLEYVAAYYGSLAAGGAVVALNTAAKARDLNNWLRHSGATWLVANAAHPELDPVVESLGDQIRVIGVGDTAQERHGLFATWDDVTKALASEPDLSAIAEADDLATIIYTSGTTGRPKGVTLTHKNLATNIRSILDYLRLGPTDSIVNVLPFYYSYGNSILHTHTAIGGKLVLENSLVYPHRILERMVVERATGFSGVPSTFSLLLSRTKLHSYDLSHMRYMTQAGGGMAPANISRLLDELPHIKFFVMYGQTEASARLSYLPPEKLREKMGSIGIAIPGVELKIVNEQGERAEAGVTGEICARGDNIMVGYWKDSETTRKVLRDEWLHTGDLAHCDEDGYLYIDGRSSDMIKTGANRISPKEIEESILELEGVEEVAAVGVPDEILGEVIKVVVVPKPEATLERKTILWHCRKTLAVYKIPKIVEFGKELPKTPSGKIKRYMLTDRNQRN